MQRCKPSLEKEGDIGSKLIETGSDPLVVIIRSLLPATLSLESTLLGARTGLAKAKD